MGPGPWEASAARVKAWRPAPRLAEAGRMLLFLISRDCVRNAGHPPPRGPCAVKGQLRVHKGREHLEARARLLPFGQISGPEGCWEDSQHGPGELCFVET